MTAASSTDRRLYAYGTLSASYDGVETRLEGAGSVLDWEVDDARGLLSHLPPLDRSSVAGLARRLHGVGLTLRLLDRRGPFLELGDVRPSIVGRVVFGSSRVRPRRLRRWPRLAASYGRTMRAK